MNADRLDYYRNQLLGTPMADLGRKMREVLLNATDEAAREEREACAKLAEQQKPVSREEAPNHWAAYGKMWGLRDIVASQISQDIRARGAK